MKTHAVRTGVALADVAAAHDEDAFTLLRELARRSNDVPDEQPRAPLIGAPGEDSGAGSVAVGETN